MVWHKWDKMSATHLEWLFRGLLLHCLLLEGLFSRGGWWKVLRTEAKALQKLENSTVLFLELGNQVTLCARFVRKLEKKAKKKV